MRKALFKWHSYAALFAMLPILIVSVTGSILVFKVEIDSLLRPHQMVVSPGLDAARVNLDTLMHTISNKHPNHVLAGWELFDDRARSDTAYIIKKGTEDWYKVYVDQYSGQILSDAKDMEHYITDWLLELHFAFLLHFNGTVIGAIVGLIMLFLGISGIVLYRGFWRKIFTLRLGAARRMLFSDIHKMVGIIASPIFILISFTGVYWNISIILHEVIEHSDDNEHVYIEQPYHAPAISFENLMQDTAQQIDSFMGHYLAIPNEPGMNIMFFGEVSTNNPFISQYASVITYNKDNGDLISASDIREASIWRKFDDSTRKLHFGYFAGLWSKIVWCIIGLTPLILTFTGLFMYLIRKRRVRKI